MSHEPRTGPTLRDAGDKHVGEQRTSPYPMSRLAPVHDLVDVARQIAEADRMIGAVASAELTQIADQIRALQDRARAILAEARESLEIHQARCSFQKRPGHVYHLYARAHGERFLSMIGPDEWGDGDGARTFVGSYRLELDQSWTRVDGGQGRRSPEPVRASELLARVLPPGDGSR
ncbi:MAG: hypothetical protein OHK0013_26970 [Sandaracinaceae bacterium]